MRRTAPASNLPSPADLLPIQPRTPSRPLHRPVPPLVASTSSSSTYYASSRLHRPSTSSTSSTLPPISRRSPSIDSLPAYTASSPAASSTYYTSGSSPPAQTPPDSPTRSFSQARTSDDCVLNSPKPRIKRCDDDAGLRLLLMALEGEESSYFTAQVKAKSPLVKVYESPSVLVKIEPRDDDFQRAPILPLILSPIRCDDAVITVDSRTTAKAPASLHRSSSPIVPPDDEEIILDIPEHLRSPEPEALVDVKMEDAEIVERDELPATAIDSSASSEDAQQHSGDLVQDSLNQGSQSSQSQFDRMIQSPEPSLTPAPSTRHASPAFSVIAPLEPLLPAMDEEDSAIEVDLGVEDSTRAADDSIPQSSSIHESTITLLASSASSIPSTSSSSALSAPPLSLSSDEAHLPTSTLPEPSHSVDMPSPTASTSLRPPSPSPSGHEQEALASGSTEGAITDVEPAPSATEEVAIELEELAEVPQPPSRASEPISSPGASPIQELDSIVLPTLIAPAVQDTSEEVPAPELDASAGISGVEDRPAESNQNKRPHSDTFEEKEKVFEPAPLVPEMDVSTSNGEGSSKPKSKSTRVDEAPSTAARPKKRRRRISDLENIDTTTAAMVAASTEAGPAPRDSPLVSSKRLSSPVEGEDAVKKPKKRRSSNGTGGRKAPKSSAFIDEDMDRDDYGVVDAESPSSSMMIVSKDQSSSTSSSQSKQRSKKKQQPLKSVQSRSTPPVISDDSMVGLSMDSVQPTLSSRAASTSRASSSSAPLSSISSSSSLSSISSTEEEPKRNTNKREEDRSMLILKDLDLPALLIDILVFGRLSFLGATDLSKALLKDHPHLLERLPDRDQWINVVKGTLLANEAKGAGEKTGSQSKSRSRSTRGSDKGSPKGAGMFGRIERHGLDPDGNKLEDVWFYEASMDPDRSRAETLADFAPSRRRKAKMGDRQYFYAPVDMNRWVVASELEDDE